MSLRGVQNTGSLCGIFSLGMLTWACYQTPFPLAAVFYVLVGGYVGILGSFSATRSRLEKRDDRSKHLNVRALALVLVGWQVTLIGLFNVWYVYASARGSLLAGYLLIALFIFLSYKLTAISDRRDQEGGFRPFSYFGRPRSRRFLFCCLVYTPIGIPWLTVTGVFSNAGWGPPLLRAPQSWLVAALLSAAFLGQRYRGIRSQDGWARGVAIVTLVVVSVAAVFPLFLFYDTTTTILSSVAVGCEGVAMYWITSAREL